MTLEVEKDHAQCKRDEHDRSIAIEGAWELATMEQI